jgi:hypothetical protein
MSIPSAGASASLLPTSQGVEGRPRRRVGHTALRWGLRTLVIGGFAGAAWLLSGTPAHAAGSDAPVEARTAGPSVMSLVNGLGTEVAERSIAESEATSTPVTGALDTVGTSPTALVTDAARKPAGVTSVALPGSLTDRLRPLVPARPADQPSGVAGDAWSTSTDRAPAVPALAGVGDMRRTLPGLDDIARVLAAPFRLTDGPVGSHGLLSPVAEPLHRTLRPVSGLLLNAADRVTSAPIPVAMRLPGAVWTPGLAHPSAPFAGPPAPGAVTTLPAVDPVGEGQATSRRSVSVQRPVVADMPQAGAPTSAVGLQPAPDRPVPAPSGGRLGAVSGIPAGASGASSDGGQMATGSSSVTAGRVDAHRLPVATGVGLRRFDAEAPTVSPD